MKCLEILLLDSLDKLIDPAVEMFEITVLLCQTGKVMATNP